MTTAMVAVVVEQHTTMKLKRVYRAFVWLFGIRFHIHTIQFDENEDETNNKENTLRSVSIDWIKMY